MSLLGQYLQQHAHKERSEDPELRSLNERHYEAFEELIRSEHIYNAWFTEENIRLALGGIAFMLNYADLEKWMKGYPELPVNEKNQRKVGVLMAGNIPLVGFHDFLAVLASGHHFHGKLSSKDDRLMKYVADMVISMDTRLQKRIHFTEDYLANIDAIIATGSTNSSRYFEYYFRNIPHIIRKNRNAVAVITGEESGEELQAIGKDIFTYFGLGCRNVTKIFIPENYKVERLLEAFESFTYLSEHHKYTNNLEYHRAVFLMNLIPFLDNGIVLFREEKEKIASPVGVVFFEKYSELEKVEGQLEALREDIQCVITTAVEIKGSVHPGESQRPRLWEYADGIDTMKFLTDLSS